MMEGLWWLIAPYFPGRQGDIWGEPSIPMSETVNGGKSGDIQDSHVFISNRSDHVFGTPVISAAKFTAGVMTLNRRDFRRRSPRRVHIRSKSTKRRHPFARSCMKNMAMIMSTLEADDWFRNPHFFFVFWLVLVLSSIFFGSGGMLVGILGASPMGEPHGRHGRVP